MNKVRESFDQFHTATGFGVRVRDGVSVFPLHLINDWLAQFENMELVPIEKKVDLEEASNRRLEPEIEPCYLHPKLIPFPMSSIHDPLIYTWISCGNIECWRSPKMKTTSEAITEWNKLMRLARGVR